jgi:U3 small nucleolar RNA-associated protein 6
LLRALKELISGYPLPEILRDGLLNHLYALLQQHLGDDPDAVSLLVTRFMDSHASGTGIVEALKHSNEEFVQAVRRSQGHDGMCSAYANFVEEWCKKEIDANMVSGVNFRLDG